MKKCSTKLWKIMKICASQAVVAMIICGVSLAHENYGQVLDKKVTVNIKDVSLEEALYEIQDASGVKIYFSLETLKMDEDDAISIQANDEPLRDILNDLLHPRGIEYRVDKKHGSIIILKKATKQLSSGEASVTGSFLFSGSVQRADLITVTGTVTDAATQQPLAGVNILVKGTTTGTASDANGKYSLSVDENDVLVFSFIGYASLEVNVEARVVINVLMEQDVRSLNEVIVNAGYYETTKEFQTGSIVKVDSKTVDQNPVSNPIASLQGRVSGLEVIQQNGVPGGNFKVRIRGTNSIANGNDPLYIIDGVPYISSVMSFSETSGNILGTSSQNSSQGASPLNTINPSDIASIEVLKDADATAIYGSRGANGVILITTKKGTVGRTKINADFYTGISKVASCLNLLNTTQYVKMRREAFELDDILPTPANAPDLVSWDTTRYTDWQEELIGGTATVSDAQISLSGGEMNTQFLIGGGFHRETTVFPGKNFDRRISFHSNITNTAIKEKLKTSLSINYALNSTNLLGEDLTTRALTLPPNAPEVYDSNGKLRWENWNVIENPLAFLKRKYEANASNLIGNLVLKYQVVPSLTAKVNLGYTFASNKAIATTPASSLRPTATQLNRASFSNSLFQNSLLEPQLVWKPESRFSGIEFLLGATFLTQTNEGLAQYATGFASESLIRNIGAAPTISAATNYYADYRYHAVFGRVNYNINEKYVINITGRRDGSSRFGPGKQFAFFGAIGSAWIFSKERLIKEALPCLSFGKARITYGVTGNDQIGNYQFLDTYTSSGNYQEKIGLMPVRLFNPAFGWESNRKFESSVEFGFLRNRVTLLMTYYRNRSSNQLVAIPLAPTTGFNSVQGNFPAVVENTGLELEIGSVNIEGSSFVWSTSANFTLPTNKLVDFPNLSASPNYEAQYVVGEPLDIRKLYTYVGIDPVAGIYRFRDVNNDGIFDISDRAAVKFVGRAFFGGLHNHLQYKDVKLDFLLQFVNQESFDYTHLFSSAPGTFSNQPATVMSRWGSDTNSEIQRFTTTGQGSEAYSTLLYSSDRVVSNASFVRLKNLSLSYSLPTEWTSKANVSAVDIYVQGQNVLTWTSYDGLDPETPGAILPPLRTLTFGIHLTL